MANHGKSVEAPTDITLGSGEGGPIVLNGPASPDETVTVTPDATANSSNCRTASASPRSGIGELPNAWFSTLTWSTFTAELIASRKPEVVEASFSPNTLSPTRLTPGATPSILTLQGLAGDSALKPWA